MATTRKPKFSAAPKPTSLSAEQADYIEKGRGKDKKPAGEEPMARVSLDVPQSIQRRFKAACSLSGTKMTREIIEFMESRTKELMSNEIK